MEEGIATISSTSSAQRQAAIRQQLMRVELATKDADTAFILELVGGIFGLLGIGYMYAGLTNAGVVRLIGYWIFLAIMWTLFGIFGLVTLGLGYCLFLAPLAVQFVIPFFSANDLKQSLVAVKGTRSAGHIVSGAAIYPAPGATADAMRELEQDLYPGIERELEQDRLDQERQARERHESRQDDADTPT
jgi:hypothetical protein